MAAGYAADHGGELSGVILLAAYPTKALPDNLLLISIWGSEDGVLNREKMAEGQKYYPERWIERELDGGNHAGFGNYGRQKGDGEARLSAEEQQELTFSIIIDEERRESSALANSAS